MSMMFYYGSNATYIKIHPMQLDIWSAEMPSMNLRVYGPYLFGHC